MLATLAGFHPCLAKFFCSVNGYLNGVLMLKKKRPAGIFRKPKAGFGDSEDESLPVLVLFLDFLKESFIKTVS